MKNILLILSTVFIISCDANKENKNTEADYLDAIQGTWTISEIKGITKKNITESQKTPFLKIEESKVNGTNGCNNFFSTINNIGKESIEFSSFGETKMICANMKVADTFSRFISKIISYSMEKNTLSFFNAEGEKLLVFTKA